MEDEKKRKMKKNERKVEAEYVQFTVPLGLQTEQNELVFVALHGTSQMKFNNFSKSPSRLRIGWDENSDRID